MDAQTNADKTKPQADADDEVRQSVDTFLTRGIATTETTAKSIEQVTL